MLAYVPGTDDQKVQAMGQRFQKLMPLIEGVPGFTGVRIHGGNTHLNTEGCPLLGKVRTADGVANCAERNATLIEMILAAEDEGRECWLEVV